mgnify:CR=1 FL=1|tara:strand:+ start:821 stop:1036 length:216 start_codon:yes stop_codon:yes gene_type:complete
MAKKEKTELQRFQEFVKWFEELVFGVTEKPKRARTKKGTYKADDPKTKDYNEAYVGGKAPRDLLGLKKRKK